MLLTESPPLLQVHCPKTGGRWLSAVLAQYAHGRRILSKHAPAWMIDDDERYREIRFKPELIRIGTVRDPWSWYYSLYLHARDHAPRVRQSLNDWGQNSPNFRDVLYGWTHPEKRSRVNNLGVLWEPAEAGGWEGLLASELGLCSFSFIYHYGTKASWKKPFGKPTFAVDLFVDCAQLETAVRRLMCRPGVALPPPVTTSGTGPHKAKEAYSPDMLAWVEEADRPLIEFMGYTPFGASAGAIMNTRGLGARRRTATE